MTVLTFAAAYLLGFFTLPVVLGLAIWFSPPSRSWDEEEPW